MNWKAFILCLLTPLSAWAAVPAVGNFATNNFKWTGQTMQFQPDQGLGSLMLTNSGLTVTRPPGATSFVYLAQASINQVIVDPRNYGAKGDANTDDTIALQSAFNAATAKSGAVYLPALTFKITAPLYATNLSIYGVPDQSIILPSSSVLGAALVPITTNSQAQNYSPKSIIRGVFIDGRNNPSGTGFCIGTNYILNGNYTANVTLDQCRSDNFTNGVGFWWQNVLSSRMTRCTGESNYNAGILAGNSLGITTLQIDNSNFRWSLDWGLKATNIITPIGPNNIFESNKKGAIQVTLDTAGDYLCVALNHFEKNWYQSVATNVFDIEVYGPTSGSLKTGLLLQGNHFDSSIWNLMVTNIGHAVWGFNDIYSSVPNSVQARGSTFLTIQDFPLFQSAPSFFVLPEAPDNVAFAARRSDTNQFEYFGEAGTDGRERVRGYTGNGIWQVPVQVKADGVTQAFVWMQDTNTSGHTFNLWPRWNNTAGRFAINDQGVGEIFDATTNSFNMPANLSVGTGLTYGTTLHNLAATFQVNADGSITGPQKFANLTASTLMQADGTKSATSLGNVANSVLVNNGSQPLYQTGPTGDFVIQDKGSTNWTFHFVNGGLNTLTHSP